MDTNNNAPVTDAKTIITKRMVAQRCCKNEWIIRVEEPLEFLKDATTYRDVKRRKIAAGAIAERKTHSYRM